MRGESQRYWDREPAMRRYPGQEEEPRYREAPSHGYAEPEERRYRGPERSPRREPGASRFADPEDGYRYGGHRASASWGYWDDEEDFEGSLSLSDSATGGADGNERLTGLTGMVLLVLFAAEGFTILAVRQMLTLHVFLGMLLIGPVLLKICSTGYRFVRYYTGAAEYRRKGPPALPLRVLGPFVILTSLMVIGTGIMLTVTGPGPSIWLLAHKAAFVLWFAVMTIHVLAYVWRLPRLVGSDMARQAGYRAGQVLGGGAARWLLLTAALLTGLLLAVVTVHLAGPWVAVPRPGR